MPHERASEIASSRPILGQLSKRAIVHPAKTIALSLHPAVELGRGSGNVKTIEERAAIQLYAIADSSLSQRLFERSRVAPDDVTVDSQLIIRTTHDCVGAKRPAKKKHCLAECVARTVLVVLGPEKGQHPIPSVKSSRLSNGEVNE
jgi:hypothetical protein